MLFLYSFRSNIFNLSIPMKRSGLFFLLFFCISQSFCADYSKIDKQSATVPTNLKTATEITAYLTKNLNSTTAKARAIYYWIANNIKYDVPKMKANSSYFNQQELVDEVLLKRQGVCANYAALFQACCQFAGIESFVIEGYVRQNGKLFFNGHAWNAIKVDNRYYDIDATWAAGYIENDKFIPKFMDDYFMVLPDEFIKTHMPVDPVWQFSSNPLTYKEFDSGNFQKLAIPAGFNYSDSIKSLSGLSTLEKLQRKQKRIIRCGVTSDFIKNELNSISKEIENEGFRLTAEKLDEAVTELNEGISAYNNYVLNRNGFIIHSNEEKQKLLNLLKLAREKTLSASEILSGLNTTNLKLSTDIKQFSKDIEKILLTINTEITKLNDNLTN